jgi:hypothetical protein
MRGVERFPWAVVVIERKAIQSLRLRLHDSLRQSGTAIHADFIVMNGLGMDHE